ncbi:MULTISPECIES: ABC transporter ATP-binding protein [unclassified Microbacterium]|uniref:ABC transporter ATP-binding protein n=1 Tax=unclassified Microbacterium TaxID=2609290 RepID=UPI00214C0E42|nr:MULTISPECIES: ABC transporter ATP-binding protein [unclassified Microbacterium]MCR2783525.1 ABC transporter ATP-binding protein [Microbacterium sp. zg.B96]WIM15614.1 ABC transporter ATP-binding protein [Microbacterium sp. zg-B96]
MSLIDLQGVRKSFGDVEALREVTFSVAFGEVFGLLGPNGAGKSTTVECIAGTLKPDAGRVSVLGVEPTGHRRFVRDRVGYQLQSAALPPALRVGEALDLFATFYSLPADVTELLDLVGLTDQRRRPFGALSGGQKQRLSVALALVGNPRVAIFDELTTGLDPQGRRDVRALIERVRDTGLTVLLVTHDLDEAERLCDRVAVIDRGRTRFVGTPDELIDSTRPASGAAHGLEDAYLRLLDPALSATRGEA